MLPPSSPEVALIEHGVLYVLAPCHRLHLEVAAPPEGAGGGDDDIRWAEEQAVAQLRLVCHLQSVHLEPVGRAVPFCLVGHAAESRREHDRTLRCMQHTMLHLVYALAPCVAIRTGALSDLMQLSDCWPVFMLSTSSLRLRPCACACTGEGCYHERKYQAADVKGPRGGTVGIFCTHSSQGPSDLWQSIRSWC